MSFKGGECERGGGGGFPLPLLYDLAYKTATTWLFFKSVDLLYET